MAHIIFTKPKEWSKRYILPELAGLVFALIGTHLAFAFSNEVLLASFVSAWSENIGYYSIAIYRETKHVAELRPDTTRAARFFLVLRNLMVEFGAAECIDSFFMRPACMFIFLEIFLSPTVGTIFGKLTADIGFYAIAVTGYELRKKYLK